MAKYCFPIILVCVLLQIKLGVLGQNQKKPPICASGQRIINGTQANINDYPFMVSIQWFHEHICGGVIVSANYVFTTASCIEKFISTPSELIILAGTSIRNDYDNDFCQIATFEEAIVHEQYNKVTFQNDIAILKLTSPFTFSDTVKAIGFFEESNPIEYLRTTTMIGWGVLVQGASTYPKLLQQKSMRSYSSGECIFDMLAVDRLVDPVSMFCAWAHDDVTGQYVLGGTCRGDFGGPLVTALDPSHHQMELVGLASWGFHCDRCFPHVFTNLQGVRGWITEKTGLWPEAK